MNISAAGLFNEFETQKPLIVSLHMICFGGYFNRCKIRKKFYSFFFLLYCIYIKTIVIFMSYMIKQLLWLVTAHKAVCA